MDEPCSVPCGQCIGCRLEYSRQWAVRCVHEASLFERNCFITLTYDDDHIPHDGSLSKREFQLFMKKLRRRFTGHESVIDKDNITYPIRYFHCGEYGEQEFRPHYHACLFNFDFDDRELWSIRDDVRLYTSESLKELWPYGFSTIGDVTFDSAAYVARYVVKKVTGKLAKDWYERVDTETGEVINLQKEYVTMSRRPGIAARWFEKFKDDCYPSDFIVVNGAKMKPPKYYDRLFEHEYSDEMEVIKDNRLNAIDYEDNTPQRLKIKQIVKEAQISFLKRDLEKY